MLIAKDISKNFSGVRALESVNMEIHLGQVTALIGENGAGKSTLMKILSGVYPDYDGEIIFNGKRLGFSNPSEAQHEGIAIIHQELSLIPQLSIAENIFLGREITYRFGTLNKKLMWRRAKELLDRLKLDLDPNTPVYTLKVGQQQIVEIAKALLTDAEIIIMDEPTSAISDQEVDILFEIVKNLRNQNKGVVYISHKLDELIRIADRFVVLRDGKTIESGLIKGMNKDNIIQKMVGRNIQLLTPPEVSGQEEKILEVKNLSYTPKGGTKSGMLKHISFNLYKGEILGIFGLMGTGRTELLESLFGLHPGTSEGEIHINGTAAAFQHPSDAIQAGLALVPEDRKKDGLVLGLDVRTNISLTVLDKLENFGTINHKKETRLAGKYIGELGIKTSSQKQLVMNLSGGNQQKIVISKWLATHPKILLLDEPTRGIDVNAKNEIYKLITQLAKEGLGIIMVSSELPEILAVSNRVLVMAEGELTAEIPISEANEEVIMQAAIPKSKQASN
ncbi:sugar ABC transporter ATP-binding protein [Arthrospiribacter ruber]|uniref:Sugar ABC transporter ATP-binding protein n=1 Tax=Arthrospiribacter ruber TaxID=2487934 RepID=A0A951IW55_9BACT|nr:sugar ABC transporter ATP-binding protein [Arthrospiribacter ruber]MBW3466999.1 sugar ABC transporter ATP-binding protein [Arthrospiribacter ruber]